MKKPMELQIAKWGNSLALRLPAAVARRMGLRDGLTVRAELTPDGSLAIQTAAWNRSSFAAELDAARQALPMGAPVIEDLRRAARY